MKKIGIFLVASFIVLFFFAARTNSQFQPYYSGDAVSFGDRVVFGTANSGKLEIFKLEGKTISRIMEITNSDPVFKNNINFSDLKLSVENNQLYVYAVSEYTLYKYNLSDLATARLEKKMRNNYWEWYQRVDFLGGRLATFSEKGIKIYNQELEVIDSYNFSIANPYSLRSSGSSQYILALDEGKIKIYDRSSRKVAKEIPFTFSYPDNNHKAYLDVNRQEIYAIDDTYTKKFNLEGKLLGSFKHLDRPGYEVDSTSGNNYLYFSNGMGVVKMTKADFKVADFAFTNLSGGPQGWAMGLKVVNTNQGDILVVFNGSNIILLDKNLNKIDAIKAKTDSQPVFATENLFLNLDRSWALPKTTSTVSGGGYWPNEILDINLANSNVSVSADSRGRFTKTINVPDVKAGQYDIKVTGRSSGATYSISLQVK